MEGGRCLDGVLARGIHVVAASEVQQECCAPRARGERLRAGAGEMTCAGGDVEKVCVRAPRSRSMPKPPTATA